MTAALKVPRYFVLIVNGQPFTHEGSQDVPMIFRDESTAVATGYQLGGGERPRTLTLESYADDYSFIGSRSVEG